MPETPELFSEIANLRDQVDDMSRSVSAIARRSGVREEILEVMEKDVMLTRIFLLVDGRRTQKDIVAALRAAGAGGSPASVSRKIDALVEDWDLIRPTTRNASGIRYVHTSLAKALRIARALER
jgi:hypothetical protein